MTKIFSFRKITFLLLLSLFHVLTSCSSENNKEDSGQTFTVIGKWHNYKRTENGKTYTDTGADPISNLNYEFQTNSCIITEEGQTKNYIYKVDGDYIKFYNTKTEVLTGSEKIVNLTQNELVVINQYNVNELKYFKRL